MFFSSFINKSSTILGPITEQSNILHNIAVKKLYDYFHQTQIF